MTVAERTINIDGLSLAILEAGAGGRPLLLVHGFTGCKEDFGDEVERLAASGYHVVVPDLRGHGSSSKPAAESAYSFELFAQDLFGLVDQLGWSQFDLLGHSMGGMVTQVMVLAQPERVGQLVLMNTHHGRIEHVDFGLTELGLELTRTKGLEVIQQIMAEVSDPADAVAFERVCSERPGYREWADAKMLRCASAMYASMIVGFEAVEDRLEALSELSHPTLVMVGELDRGFRPAADRLAAAMSGAELVVFDGAGHCPQFEATEAWRTSLDGFLARAGTAVETIVRSP